MKKKILVLSGIFLLIDQILKILVRNSLKVGIEKYIIPKFFYLTYAKNTGGAFSLFENNPILLAVIGVIALIFLFRYILSDAELDKLEIVCYSMLIGGIIGNLLDRIIFNYVTDYIGLVFGSYYYPVFNFADMLIVISIGLLFIKEVRGDKHGTNSK